MIIAGTKNNHGVIAISLRAYQFFVVTERWGWVVSAMGTPFLVGTINTEKPDAVYRW